MTIRKHGHVAGILFLAVALMPIAAVAGPFEDGLKAAESGDFATALRLWQPLAEQGHAEAQNNLGVMYGYCYSVPQDDAEAAKWYRLAAEQGHAYSQGRLGGMLLDGRGVPRDYVQAHMWFSLAVSRLPPGGKRDMTINNRNAAAEHMTPEQIAEAEKLARAWRPRGGQAE